MSRDPSNDTVTIPCRGCGRDVMLPAGPLRAAKRLGRSQITFCSRRCQRRSIATEGSKLQDEALRARHHPADPGS